MNRKIWTMAVIVALLACRASETQLFQHGGSSLPPDPAPKASDLTADQLLAKYAAARGGEQKLKAIQSVRMTGTWTSNIEGPSPITIMIAPGRYLRRIAQGSTVSMMSVVDGQTTWEVVPRNGITKPTPMVAKKAARFFRLADPQGPLVDPKAKGNSVEVVGKMPWQGSEVYKLKVRYRDGNVSYFYLDAKSFLPVRTVTSLYVPQLDKDIEMELVYQDFRDVDGVKWPFKEKAVAPAANFDQSITWEKVEANKPLDEAAFKAPKS